MKSMALALPAAIRVGRSDRRQRSIQLTGPVGGSGTPALLPSCMAAFRIARAAAVAPRLKVADHKLRAS
jgi:hypothetical protein